MRSMHVCVNAPIVARLTHVNAACLMLLPVDDPSSNGKIINQ